jgi:ribosomal protein S18 acetylase RimI-like enzyme
MELRPYRTEDWATVCEIYDHSKPDELRGVVDPNAILPLDADPNMKALFSDSRIVVMEDADRVVGFAGSRDSFITWLFAHPVFRRKGVATALVRHVLAQLESPVTLNVAMSNAAARALYERIGFKVEREFQGNFQGIPCRVAKLTYETAA